VGNRPVFDLYIVPGELEHPNLALRRVVRALDLSKEKLQKKLDSALEKAPLENLAVKRSLDERSLSVVSPLVQSTPGLYLGSRSERRFPHGKLASHIIGYVGAINNEELRTLRSEGFTGRDFVGKTGLEKYYDDALRGRPGIMNRWVDASGRTLRKEIVRAPVAGQDILLNVDLALQKKVEQALSESLVKLEKENGSESGAAAVVYGVKTGEIKALASLPNFDPRPFARGIKGKEYAALLDDKTTPLVNRATHAAFSPGSTFKMITGMAALQLGLCNSNSRFYCGGSYKGANCFVRSGHGNVSFRDSIAFSCDVVYYKLGDTMGIRNLAEYARSAGLGSPSGLDLPHEDSGLIPDPEWKQNVRGEPWYGGDTINSSIGQGFVLTTPLQMARAVAAIANKGVLTEPRIADRALFANGRHAWQNSKKQSGDLPVDNAFLQTIRQGMRGAVTRGTSVVVNSPVVKVAGKTGTVESFPNPYNPQGRNHTWFVCFAPYDDPEIAVAVFFQKSDGYGGGVAAPVARRIIDAYFGTEKNE